MCAFLHSLITLIWRPSLDRPVNETVAPSTGDPAVTEFAPETYRSALAVRSDRETLNRSEGRCV